VILLLCDEEFEESKGINPFFVISLADVLSSTMLGNYTTSRIFAAHVLADEVRRGFF